MEDRTVALIICGAIAAVAILSQVLRCAAGFKFRAGSLPIGVLPSDCDVRRTPFDKGFRNIWADRVTDKSTSWWNGLSSGTAAAPFVPPAAVRSQVRDRLVKIYKAHRPEKIEVVDSLLVEWHGDEWKLLEEVMAKYSITEAFFADEKAEAQKRTAEQEQRRLYIENQEQERLAAEKAEQERLAAEKAEQKRLAAEKAEQERLAAEKAEQERLAAEKAEQERLAAEKAEQERLAAEKAEQERLAAEEAEQERLAAEEAEQERLAAEEAEQERLAAEKEALTLLQAEVEEVAHSVARQLIEEAEQARRATAARIAAEKAEQERLAKERAERDRLAAAEAERQRLGTACPRCEHGGGGDLCKMHLDAAARNAVAEAWHAEEEDLHQQALKAHHASIEDIQAEINEALTEEIPFIRNTPTMINPEGTDVVLKVAHVLRKYPFVHILVDGHAKGQENTEYLQKLSSDRATAVMRKLAMSGVPQDYMTVRGSGAIGRGMHVFITVLRIIEEKCPSTVSIGNDSSRLTSDDVLAERVYEAT
jgi:outer membrane protein OmpA-like peptidoglycan-associated protein